MDKLIEVTGKDREPTYDYSHMKEYYKKIFTYAPAGMNLKIGLFDAEHFEARFHQRFSYESWENLKKVLVDGLKAIRVKFNLKPGYYMVISKKLGLKIPVGLRPDRFNPKMFIGILTTVLDKDEHPYNLKNDINIIVESQNGSVEEIEKFYLDKSTEGYYSLFEYDFGMDLPFSVLFENGKMYKTFKEVYI